jgi:hypothetical protein
MGRCPTRYSRPLWHCAFLPSYEHSQHMGHPKDRHDASTVGGIIGTTDYCAQLGGVWTSGELRCELMEVVGIHSSYHVIAKPEPLALRPGNLRNPTIGIGITVGEHFLHVFLQGDLEHQPFLSRFRILLKS